MKIGVTCMYQVLNMYVLGTSLIVKQPRGGRIYLDHGSKDWSIHHDMEGMAMQASIRGKSSL